MSEAHVLDASALLCLLRNEAGAAEIASHLQGSLMSAVYHSEVIAKMAELGLRDARIAAALGPLPIRIVAFDAEQARVAGLLRPATRALGLSLGDRACLALAKIEEAVAITTDRDWLKLEDLGVQIHCPR